MVPLREIFALVAVVGIVILASLIAVSANPAAVSKYRIGLKVNRVMERFRNDQVDALLHDAGLPIKSQLLNYIRFGSVAALALFSLVARYLGLDFNIMSTLLTCLIFLAISSPKNFMPLGFILNNAASSRANRRSIQLLAFMQLYRNYRSMPGKRVQFWSFCMQVAPYLPLLERDLKGLASRLTEDGLEPALKWFEDQFPEEHPFSSELLSIILSAERAQNQEAVSKSLSRQSELLAQISSARYVEKWKVIGDVTSSLSNIPPIIALITLILLAFKYISIVNKNLFF